MHITMDISPAVHKHAGLGRYAAELLTALMAVAPEHEYSAVYYAPTGNERPAPPLDNVPAQALRLGAKPWRMNVLLSDYLGRGMDRAVPAGDVFHGTDHLLPVYKHSRTVFTVHDLIYLFYPQYHLRLNRWFLTLMLPRFLRRADGVIAVSEHTRRDVMTHMRIPEEKITVIYEGANPNYRPLNDPAAVAAVRAKYNVPERYILFFSTIEPRKNLGALLGAYHALLARPGTWPDLVIAGRKGWLYEPVFARVQALGLTERVRFTDWVAEADAPALMNGAEVFVYPSLYEGFGLPPLEAMACGVPVVASSASSIPEIVGEAGLLVNPTDEGALMEAMQAALTDPQLRASMRARGLARAKRFTWEAAARETLKVYARVVDEHGAKNNARRV